MDAVRTRRQFLSLAAWIVAVASAWIAAALLASRVSDGPKADAAEDRSGANDALEEPAAPQESRETLHAEAPASALLSRLHGRVRDSRGEPIAAASVSLDRLVRDENVLDSIAARDERRTWARALSDASGRFALAAPQLDECSPLVLLVQAPGYELGARILREIDGAPIEIVLEAAAMLEVRVVDGAARPVAGAVVHQRYVAQWPRIGAFGATDTRSIAATYDATFETDFAGRALLPLLSGYQAVWATMGALTSATWIGEQPDGVRLVLGATFEAYGTIAGLPRDAPALEASIACSNVADIERHFVRSEPVAPDGSWRLTDLPLDPEREYAFHLSGASFANQEVVLPAPRAGESVRVDFEYEPARALAVRVIDREKRPLENAVVTSYWQIDGRYVGRSVATNESGAARLDGLADEEMVVCARKIGFVQSCLEGALRPSEVGAAAHEIVMQPAGRVVGRCRAAGKSLTNFEIVYIPESDGMLDRRVFMDAPDGRFELLECPLGNVTLLASSGTAGQSEAARVLVRAEEAARVELELLPLVVGRGRVVDAVTQEPLEDALVQPWTVDAGEYLAPRGDPIRMRSDGSFELAAFVAGTNRIEVSAPGRAKQRFQSFAAPGGSADFGVMALSATQTLTVRAVPDGPCDLRALRATCSSPDEILERAFDEHGVARFEDLSPGVYAIGASMNGRSIYHRPCPLKAGARWDFELPLAVSETLEIALESEDGAALAEPVVVWLIAFHSVRGESRHSAARAADGVYRASRPRECEAFVRVWSAAREVAFEHFERSELASGRVRVRVKSSTHVVRVVDEHGEPIADVHVLARVPDRVPPIAAELITGADGRAVLPSSEAEAIDALLYHATRGVARSTRIALHDGDAEPHAIVFAPVGQLDVHVRDGETSLPGVEVLFTDPLHNAGRAMSDEGGHARSLALGAGAYRARVEQPGLWPAHVDVDMRAGLPPVELQVRRLGSLEVRARSLSGASLRGASIELTSTEFGGPASHWLDQGAIQSSTSSMALDRDGALRLDGLPRGAYAWELRIPGAEPIAGRAEVPPNGVARLEIVSP